MYKDFWTSIFPRCHASETHFMGYPSKHITIPKSPPKKPYSAKRK